MVDDNKRLEAISKLLRKLPESNYASLAVIAELLHEVAKRSKVNKCSRRYVSHEIYSQQTGTEIRSILDLGGLV